MSGGDDRRLRIAIAQFDAVMRQSQMSGPEKDAIDVVLEAPGDDGSQSIKVTYIANGVVAKIDRDGRESVRQAPSVKVGTTIRLVCLEDPAAAVQMEIAGKKEPFDASDARVRIERLLMDEVGKAIKAELGR